MSPHDNLFSSTEKSNEIEGAITQIGFVPPAATNCTGHFVIRLEGRGRVLRFPMTIPRDMAEELAMGQRGDTLKLRFAGGLVQDFVEPVFVTVRPPEPSPTEQRKTPASQVG